MMDDIQDRREQIIDVFSEIKRCLARENEENWIRGIDSILSRLDQPFEDPEEIRVIIRDISMSFRNMRGGSGSFSDFMIWRDDFDERSVLNREFNALIDRAWTLLDL